VPPIGIEINLRRNIDLQQILAAAVTKDSHESIVYLDEPPLGSREKQPFLDRVE
jgi:hypothetical protein